MKNLKIFAFVNLLLLGALVTSCGGEKVDRPAPVLSPERIAESQSNFDTPTVPSGAVAGGVQHYICPDGHANGGGAAQGNCIQCGKALIHNQAFHDQPSAAADPSQTPGAEPPQNAAGVWHYTCPNGHTGGAGSATACAQCGTTLVHNTEYHNTPGGAPDASALTAPTQTPPPTTPEPAQNASGVWHYTCSDGHEGGAGSAVACAVCGKTLIHNQFYHN